MLVKTTAVAWKRRFPWYEIGMALRAIGYQGNVVMEPFVRNGGNMLEMILKSGVI